MSRSQRTSRQQQRLAWLGTAAGVVSLAGVGYYWYNLWSSSSGQTAADANNSTSRQSPRPQLSIHLGNPSSIPEDVVRIYNALSHLYLVHLIHPSNDNLEDSLSTCTLPETADTRRILTYSKHSGGIAIVRALDCEAHLHLLDNNNTDTQELIESLLLLLKSPNLKLLVLCVTSSAIHESILQAVKDAPSSNVAVRIIDLRNENNPSWSQSVALKLTEFRKAWR
ncbi:unnamed protein product [Sympodiomycopsis kandeliae]